MMKNKTQKLVGRIASREALRKNAKALESYGRYKEASDLIERVDIALGRKTDLKTETGSALNFEVNYHGAASTTS